MIYTYNFIQFTKSQSSTKSSQRHNCKTIVNCSNNKTKSPKQQQSLHCLPRTSSTAAFVLFTNFELAGNRMLHICICVYMPPTPIPHQAVPIYNYIYTYLHLTRLRPFFTDGASVETRCFLLPTRDSRERERLFHQRASAVPWAAASRR